MIDLAPVFSLDSAAFQAARQAQADAADPARSAWVEANAGSGKTKVLIDRVARLLLRRPDGRPGVAPNSILCVTYTKAAANEMLSRLFQRLGDWSVADDETLRRELSHLEARAPGAYSHEDLKQARTLFARALETPGGLRIETIHALCARILRRFPLEAGVSPGFTEIEDAEASQLWADVLSARLEAAVEAHPEALRILSQATGGRGADAALNALRHERQNIAAFAQQVRGQAPDARDAMIRAAAQAPDQAPAEIISEAMGSGFPTAEIQAAIQDLEAGERKQTDDALLAGLIAVLNTPDPETRFTLYMSAIGGKAWDFSPRSNPYTKAAGPAVADLFCRDTRSGDPEGREITRIRAAQGQLAAAELAARTSALMTIGLPMVEAYAQEKRARAALDFDDLIEFTRALLTRSGAAQWVLYKLDGGLSHLLLDEAQDTSPPQWALINALVEEFRAGLGQETYDETRTQFVVGDPKQSIYSFQGANEAHFSAERQTFLRREEPQAIAEGRAVNLPMMAMSFRSCPQVLEFVDAVRAHVPLHDAAIDPLPPVDADLTAHQARRANQPGRVELWPLEMPNPAGEEDDDWTTPLDHVPKDAPRRRLADTIAAAIRAMIDRGETVWQENPDRSWQRRAMVPEDVLILVRRRNDLFEALIDSLKKQGLPVAGADRLKLLNNIGVQDCLNLIRFALQPGDDLTLAEILRGPFCGLVDDDNHLFVLAQARARGDSLWATLRSHPDARFIPARDFIETLLSHRENAAFDFLALHLNQRRSDGLSGWDRLVQRLGEPVRDPVRALLSKALGHDMAEPASLQAFLAEIETEATELKRELSEPDGAIRVMTVHGAKGLQAPVVILPDTTAGTRKTTKQVFLSDDNIPLYAPSAGHDSPVTADLRELENQAAERESRRLLYVAMTRASDRLIIAGAGRGNAKTGYDKSSWYRWCQLAMQALTGDNPQETEAPVAFGPAPPCTTPSELTGEVRPAPAWLYTAAPQATPPMRLAAPSRLVEDDARVSAPLQAGRAAALRRGHLIHAMLQTLPELQPAERDAAADRFLGRHPDLTDNERREMKAVTLRTLGDPSFAAIFAPGGRNEAAIVGTLASGQMINGRVDRLVISDHDILIIDYKTDRPAPHSLREIGTSYIVQMAAYRAVLQQIYPEPGHLVRCALLYTDGPHLIELPGELMSDSLNRIINMV